MQLTASKTYRADLEKAAGDVVSLDKLEGRSVLVTGATGTIGSFVADLLLHCLPSVTVYALGRSRERLEARFGKRERLVPVEQDMRKALDFSFQADYVIHSASSPYPSVFGKDPVGTLLETLEGTYHLLEYARSAGSKRLMYISSSEVYGKGPVPEGGYPEEAACLGDPANPRNCYPLGKLATENLCASYSAMHGFETVSVRPCYIYGPAFSSQDNRATVQFLTKALRGEEVVMLSKGSQLRSYCYAADCASAILTILANGQSGEAYNIADKDSRLTVAEFAALAAEEGGVPLRFSLPQGSELKGTAKPRDMVLNATRLESLGWKGSFSGRTGIAHTLAVLREAGYGA